MNNKAQNPSDLTEMRFGNVENGNGPEGLDQMDAYPPRYRPGSPKPRNPQGLPGRKDITGLHGKFRPGRGHEVAQQPGIPVNDRDKGMGGRDAGEDVRKEFTETSEDNQSENTAIERILGKYTPRTRDTLFETVKENRRAPVQYKSHNQKRQIIHVDGPGAGTYRLKEIII